MNEIRLIVSIICLRRRPRITVYSIFCSNVYLFIFMGLFSLSTVPLDFCPLYHHGYRKLLGAVIGRWVASGHLFLVHPLDAISQSKLNYFDCNFHNLKMMVSEICQLFQDNDLNFHMINHFVTKPTYTQMTNIPKPKSK